MVVAWTQAVIDGVCFKLSVVLQPSTPTKPVQFSDWVSGVSPPDPTTINKHVHDMVEVSDDSDVTC